MGRLSVQGLAAQVRSGELSAEAAIAQALDRIEAYDAVQPQAWIARPSREALLAHARPGLKSTYDQHQYLDEKRQVAYQSFLFIIM